MIAPVITIERIAIGATAIARSDIQEGRRTPASVPPGAALSLALAVAIDPLDGRVNPRPRLHYSSRV
jgi:hypothetical protein